MGVKMPLVKGPKNQPFDKGTRIPVPWRDVYVLCFIEFVDFSTKRREPFRDINSALCRNALLKCTTNQT